MCGKTITYGTSGKKAIIKHGMLDDHKADFKAVKNSSKIPEATHSTGLTLDGFEDQTVDIKSVLGLFISENCLALSLAPKLLALVKRLSVHQTALNTSLQSISRTCMSFTISQGIAKSVRDELSSKLQNKHFSINIDEATNSAGTKFLNVLVSYWDDELDRIVTELLGTRDSNVSTATNIVAAVEDILSSFSLDISQVVSIMSDNCNVMKGENNGVEEKLRAMKDSNLLNVGGDTVHQVDNAMKTFFKPQDKEYGISSFASKVYYDIEDSRKAKHFFQ